ncbi:hypothetical protein ABT009_18725 [Streptomyces sp. NPDC002896]|uniref:hypothetical protein n=1 Tax=Streptomyces sp. NPDC002896 TaxID=3154438 RepID=UPI00332B11BE
MQRPHLPGDRAPGTTRGTRLTGHRTARHTLFDGRRTSHHVTVRHRLPDGGLAVCHRLFYKAARQCGTAGRARGRSVGFAAPGVRLAGLRRRSVVHARYSINRFSHRRGHAVRSAEVWTRATVRCRHRQLGVAS